MDRRTFIKNAALASLALASPLFSAKDAHGAYKVDPAVVKENPEWLSHKIITSELPKGALVIENAVIKKAIFSDFTAMGSTIKNVVFEDCRFYKANFMDSALENVTFKGGVMANKGDPYFESNLTTFSFSSFQNVTMDGLKIGQANVDGITGAGTRLLLINMNMKSVPHSLLGFEDVHVRIKNCNIQGDGNLINTSGFGSVYATDSIFDGTGFQCSSDLAYVANCKLLNGAGVGNAKTIVVKDSVMSGPVGGNNSDSIYLINNTYPKTEGFTALRGKEKTKIYVDGRNVKNAVMNILGGGAYIKDLEIIAPAMIRLQEGVAEPYTVDFNNVTIRGGRIDRVRLKGGRWQDVTIYPPIRADNGQIKNVQIYNVRFPDGPPWTQTDGNTNVDMIRSPKPFDFPEIKAPTPQELGLVD